MILKRRTRKLAAALAAAAMLFAQLAIAAHACAAFAGADPMAATAAAQKGDDASPCDEMDAGRKNENVCFRHCEGAMQSLDHHQVAKVVPLALPLYHVDQPDRLAVFLESTRRHSHALLARITAPPLSVRNCCFRT